MCGQINWMSPGKKEQIEFKFELIISNACAWIVTFTFELLLHCYFIFDYFNVTWEKEEEGRTSIGPCCRTEVLSFGSVYETSKLLPRDRYAHSPFPRGGENRKTPLDALSTTTDKQRCTGGLGGQVYEHIWEMPLELPTCLNLLAWWLGGRKRTRNFQMFYLAAPARWSLLPCGMWRQWPSKSRVTRSDRLSLLCRARSIPVIKNTVQVATAYRRGFSWAQKRMIEE